MLLNVHKKNFAFACTFAWEVLNLFVASQNCHPRQCAWFEIRNPHNSRCVTSYSEFTLCGFGLKKERNFFKWGICWAFMFFRNFEKQKFSFFLSQKCIECQCVWSKWSPTFCWNLLACLCFAMSPKEFCGLILNVGRHMLDGFRGGAGFKMFIIFKGACSPFSAGGWGHVLHTLVRGDVAPTVSLHCFLLFFCSRKKWKLCFVQNTLLRGNSETCEAGNQQQIVFQFFWFQTSSN